MDEPEGDDNDKSIPGVRSKGRGRHSRNQQHSLFSLDRNQNGSHGRGGSFPYRGTRGTYRQRGDFDQDSNYETSEFPSGFASTGYASSNTYYPSSRCAQDSKGHHRKHQSRYHGNDGDRHQKDYRSKEEIEKERNKLSLLDGIQEMYKKPNQDHQAAPDTACAKTVDFPEEDFSDKGSSKRRWKKGPNKGTHYFGHGHNDERTTFRSYKHFDEGRNRKVYQAEPSAPPFQEHFEERPMTSNSFEDTHARDSKHEPQKKGRGSNSYLNTKGYTHIRKPFGHKKKPSKAPLVVDDDATQREMLTSQLEEGEFECMVCCEAVRRRDPVWSCQKKCYNMFHFHCIRKWARTPTAIVEGMGWRCPTCQDIYESIPHSYFCFCGKVRDPEMSRHDTPHSCGQVCGRKRQDPNCQHKCNILCHPGPCPLCETLVTKLCPCGKLQMQIRCGRSGFLTCDGLCQKFLNCGVHKCREKCHKGPCSLCQETVKQDCFCKKSTKEVACTDETSTSKEFCCGDICERRLKCEEHFCKESCHPGDCEVCKDLPEMVKFCPCGSKTVEDLLGGGKKRISCTDFIPTCKSTCNKTLYCGPQDNHHVCYASCHVGECPPCPLKTWLNCQCGLTSREVMCTEISTLKPSLQCDKRCNSRKVCGRHKCLNNCCIDKEHNCELTCNRKLTCGLHQCPLPCHKGNCHTCFNVSFEDLTCDCGAEVLLAPIACGTRPPECGQICTRVHSCEHPVQHNCHSEPECPPCTTLTDKWCFGNHEKRSNVVCHISGLSCGLACLKPLSCGTHRCQRVCHEGNCQTGPCNQPCIRKRSDCDHFCSAPCHEGPCPGDLACRTLIKVSCKCGNRWEEVPCAENAKLFKQVSASLLASKMQDIQLGNTVDISDLFSNSNSSHSSITKKTKQHRIECNEDCAQLERNRRLALALQIRNPDLSLGPGPPKYTDFLKDEARKSPAFIMTIHDKLTELVQLAKQSKQKSRSHSFPPGNRDQRRVIHELSEFFGCQSESFDQEPKRNVVVTAFRDRSYLPPCSVMKIVQREMGLRTVPLPVLSNSSSQQRNNSNSAVTMQSSASTLVPQIDHFDSPQ